MNTKVFSLSVILLSSTLGMIATAQTPINVNGWYPSGSVRTIVSDANYIYIGGQFAQMIKEGVNGSFTRGTGVQATGTGSVIQGFPKVNGTVNTVISDGNGGYFIGGSFTQVGSLPRSNIAHINPDRSVDATWNPNANEVVSCLVLVGNDLFVGGNFTTIGGFTRNRIAKLSNSGIGLVDADWNPNSNGYISCLKFSSNFIYVGGNFTTIGGQTITGLAKLTTTGTGSIDLTWNPNPNGTIRNFVISGTDLYACGNFGYIGGAGRPGLAKVTTTGTGAVDAIWNPTKDDAVFSLALSGNDLYLGGVFRNISGQARNSIARVTTTGTGTLDATWNPNAPSGIVYWIETSGTDVYVGGYFSIIGGQSRSNIAKLTSTGTGLADVNWTLNTNGTVSTLLVSGNELYVGGGFTFIGGSKAENLVRIQKSNLEWDQNWLPNPNNIVNALALSGTDLYVGGYFTTIAGISRSRIAKISTTGTGAVDATWNPNPLQGNNVGNYVNTLALSGTDLYVGGSFTTIGGFARNNIAKLSTTGSGAANATWNPRSNAEVSCLALSGFELYVGGNFATIGGFARNRIAKLGTTGSGTANSTWNPNASSTVNAIAVSGTAVFVGGFFSSIGGSSRIRVAKLSTTGTGTSDVSWSTNPSNAVNALAISGTDIYLGGFFENIAGVNRWGIAKLATTSTGALNTSWNANAIGPARSLSISGSEIYVGGDFQSMNGETIYNFAILTLQSPEAVTSATISGTGGIRTVTTSGGNLQMLSTYTPSNANTNTVIGWSVSPLSVATISGTGLLRAISNGIATVTGTYGTVTGVALITISGQNILPVTSATVSGTGGVSSITTSGGNLQMLSTYAPSNANTNTVIGWSVSPLSVATISGSGLLRAISNGIATVTGTYGTVTGVALITISGQNIRVTSATVSGTGGVSSITTSGGNLQMLSTYAPSNANTNTVIGWSVSPLSVATISGSGLLTGISNGIATVTGSYGTVTGVFVVTVSVSSGIVWNGTSWSGTPTAGSDVVINGNLTLNATNTGGNFTFNRVTINPGFTLAIPSGRSLTINGTLTNNGTFSILDGGALYQSVSSSIAGTGQCFVYRNGSSGAYNYVGSPVQTSAVISGSYLYDEVNRTAGDYMTGWYGASGNMVLGKGYAGYAPGNLTFTGKVNNGTVSIPVTTTAVDANVNLNGWNLLGNPYPSPVSVNAFLTANSSQLSGAATYFWSGENYIAVNSGNIPLAQGFFVKAIASGSVSFTNAQRSTGSEALYRMSGEQTPLVKLKLTSPTGKSDQTQIEQRTPATDGYDVNFDALKLKGNTELQLYSKITGENSDFAINILSEGENKVIPLSYDGRNTGTYTIELVTVTGLDNGTIVLEDKTLGTQVNLRMGSYTFNGGSATGDQRFNLRLSANRVTDLTYQQTEVSRVYASGQTIYIQSKGHFEVQVIHPSGSIAKTQAGEGDTQVQMETPGIYIVLLKGENTTKPVKVIIE